LDARLRHIEDFLAAAGHGPTNPNVAQQAAAVVGGGGSSSGGGGGGGVGALAGDVTGPAANNQVALLQGTTLTISGPAGGQVLTYNGTAWVNSFVAQVTKTANYTLAATDYAVWGDTTGGAFTLTLPTAVGIAGRTYVLKNLGTNTLTVATTGGQTIDGSTTAAIVLQYASLTVVSDGSNWWIN